MYVTYIYHVICIVDCRLSFRFGIFHIEINMSDLKPPKKYTHSALECPRGTNLHWGKLL